MSYILDSEIKFLPGIGEKRAALLEKELGIRTFRDMLYTFPYRYIDRSKVYSISDIDSSSAYIQLRGKIVRISSAGEGKGRRLIATLQDGSGSIDLVFFKGVKWIQGKISPFKEYIVFGKPSLFNGAWNMIHPELDPVGESGTSSWPSTLIGIYSSTDKLRNNGISVKVFAKLQQTLLQKVSGLIRETLPQEIISSVKLPSLTFALTNIHFPKDLRSLDAARYRLKFEELFFLQLSLLRQRNVRMSGSSGIFFKKVGDAFNWCYSRLPYELTGAQKRVIKEIRRDTVSGRQMNRLLQGDVGSGKTMVAMLSALIAVDNGYQACVMAPTEVLAVQHWRNFERSLSGSGVRVALLTGSTKARERREIDGGLRDGSIDILIGTHAVIEDNVVFHRLGFVVIDEQHRFGVDQRARLRLKSTEPPHILVMTATPIPRTLAMTLYGDLDVSVLDELPPGRKPVQTIHVTEEQRYRMYDFIKSEIKKGRQAFIVYPLIKESETLDYHNLEEGYQRIVNYFPAPEYITAVVHGQQTNENKAYDMRLFAEGKAHILVATSVIEVGVDVPNASVMVIESAERFGLSQLHQLRGRVGRGAEKSYCILMTGYKLSEDSRKRIELMCSTSDGFELAEADLRMRGPGDMEGTRQSGLAFDLKISDLGKDGPVLAQARSVAAGVLAEDPLLESTPSALLRAGLDRLRQTGGKEIIDYSTIS
ncbi:MAG TPA: ATP-dependent DNA helicase RecG [Candidatus Coprenecus stercoravium]|uniref:ATP-dependent DNA helicase RecG n=1 Tax=Candidatus Coprenecus stercoravium TaxID=2840735 RepID=A0A9D2GQJ5_9BACT|nr:ATP-dependent DNA helicase RecG [Candidatus Coprenecus stercoravium]